MMFLKAGVLIGVLLALAPVTALADAPAHDETFETKVRPLLTSRCGECHGGTERKSGLGVTSIADLVAGGSTRGSAIIPGHSEQSVLVKLLRGDLKPRMPLRGPPLSNGEIALIESWIKDLKAPEPSTGDAKAWWAVKPLVSPTPPAVHNTARVQNPIDQFVFHRLEQQDLTPAPDAAPEVLLRRAYFDLIGLPPTPEEARAFFDDQAPEAWQKLIDRLLADRRYGERWGRHWLDVVRYADSGGSEYDREYSHMWRYRDYVIRAFNDDMPYDRFVIEQLAGDEIDAPTPQSRIALGFLRMSPEHGSPNKDTNRQHRLNELTATIGSAFLGVTLGCAQCHDHKYDPITQRDFYRVQAFLVGIRLEDVDVPFEADEAAPMNAAREAAEKELSRLQQATTDLEQAYLARLGELLIAEGLPADEAAKKATKEELDQRLMKAEPEAAGTLLVAGVRRFTAEEAAALDHLRIEVVEGSLDGVFEKGCARRRVDRFRPRAHVVTNTTNDYFASVPHLPVAFVRIRGEVERLGEMVRPGYLSAVTGNHDAAPPRIDKFGNIEKFRIGLAEWIAAPDNPLTPRVMVNRLWQHHMGEGIVRTANNLGRNGAPPTHPELLDWLAAEFIALVPRSQAGDTAGTWSLKRMHRLIMNSATYRQASNVDSPAAEKIDPQNRLLWRMNRRRLEGEAVRDSVLAVSGRLNLESGGPGIYPPLPDGMDDRIYYKKSQFWEPTDGPQSRRRSVYIFKRRQLDFPLLAALDAPVFNIPSEQRPVSTTPLQALLLFNGRLVNEESDHFSRRIVAEVGSDALAQSRLAYQLALCRQPTDDELQSAIEHIATQPEGDGLRSLCRVLFNLNEFVYVE
ncbi:MAG: DUF1553 domain-containing protein [Planctomycetaceae bacterium]|nr:DUF1553 domain-containing protein [Planctomycetaceae bacterium]